MKIINDGSVLEFDRDLFVDLCSRRDVAGIRTLTEDVPPLDLAEFITELPIEEGTVLFRLLPKEQAAEVFVELDADVQRAVVELLTDRELSDMMKELYVDDTVDVLEEMPANVVKRMIRASTPETRAQVNSILRYGKDTAGALMTTEYVRLAPSFTVGTALENIRKVAIDKETVYTCLVTDEHRKLLGIVTAKRLLISNPDVKVGDIMQDNIICVHTDEGKEDVAMLFDRYRLIAIPVVDSENRLVGIITVDDAMEVLRDEAEEDFAKMAGITPVERTYLRTSVPRIFLSRIPWLLLLMISATFSSTILNRFEALLPAVLILFVPMLMDTGGNSGGQTSVTVIRSLSLGELEPADFYMVIWKELRVGLLTGGCLGLVAFGKVMLVDRLIMQNDEVTVLVALAVAVALAVTVLISKLIGALLPILARMVKLDPAVMASPFITTIVDALSLVAYFFIASAILPA